MMHKPTCGTWSAVPSRILLLVTTSLLLSACGGGSSGGGGGTDYTADWVGSYVGKGEVYNAINGITDTDIDVRLEVSRNDFNVLRVSMEYDWDGTTYSAMVTDGVDSTDHMTAEGHPGHLRELYVLDRSGSDIIGTYHQEEDATSGNYDLIRTVSFDVVLQ